MIVEQGLYNLAGSQKVHKESEETILPDRDIMTKGQTRDKKKLVLIQEVEPDEIVAYHQGKADIAAGDYVS